MESDLEENYKKNAFIHAIKTGKVPARSGLGSRLYLLAGFSHDRVPYCTLENCDFPKEYPDKTNLTKRLAYNRYVYSIKESSFDDAISSKDMRNVFDKYLKDYEIIHHWNYIFVYFDPTNMPSWAVLDNDLKLKYPNNHRVDKRGFVYYK
jgi:hypothetical protein